MGLLHRFSLAGSVSRLALGLAFAAMMLGSLGTLAAKADPTVYNGTDTALLKNEPTGVDSPYSSLFVENIYTGNTIIVKPANNATLNSDGAQVWSTVDTVNAPYVIYGGISVGAAGISDGLGNGAAGSNITQNSVAIENVQYDWTAQTAADGLIGTSVRGGVGGMGGGSIYGGVSIGGAGINQNDDYTGQGGHGGDVSNTSVSLKNVILGGANGGAGGAGDEQASPMGGGGLGGLGGASIIGGLSVGGSAGTMGDGGKGGAVYGNSLALTDVTLKGGQGGNGGTGGDGRSGGGVGGMGGGSVFGGISIGGAGSVIDGGPGSAVYDNVLNLTNVVLQGGAGGNGGDSTVNGGSGAGGMGGGSVFGGLSMGGAAAFAADFGQAGGAVYGNTLILQDVVLINADAGSAGAVGQDAGRGANGLAGGSVYGGVSIGSASGDNDGRGSLGGKGGDVSNNRIDISGTSLIAGNIYGGYSIGASAGGSTGQSGVGGNVTGNTISLEGDQIKIGLRDSSNNVTSYGAVYGGYSVNGDGSVNSDFNKVIAGNSLNLIGYRGSVSGIYNFANFNWTLPANVVNGDTLITIAADGTPVNLTSTTHTIANMQASDNRLNKGDTVTFITKTQGTLAPSSPYTINQGQFIIYEATLAQTGGTDNPLVMTVINKREGLSGSAAEVNPQSKSYSEGRAAALGFVGQGGDLIASQLSGIRAQVLAENSIGNGALIPFIIMNGSSQRYETGSHVDIDGFNMAVGLATGFDFAGSHKATIGAFFEYGRGTYDTYNSFTNFASTYGDGDSDYKGGGIFGRLDFANTGLGRVKKLASGQADGAYVEAALRAGRVSSEFDLGRNANVFGEFTGAYRGSYDSAATYYGGHLAGGYVFNFDEKQALDVYGRYLWTHMNGDDVTIANEPLHFGSSTSSRLQIGGRYAYAYNDQLKPFVGATYEYEFDGEVKAKAYEFNLDRPSLKGSTGIIEAGFNFQPVAANKALSIDVNGQGYVGQRQGGGGGVKVKYQF